MIQPTHEPAVADALLHAARCVRGGTEARRVQTSAGYDVDVVVRRVRGDDRRSYVYGHSHRLALRVDLVAAAARGLPVDEATVDAYLAAQSTALDVLFGCRPPVFEPMKFRLMVDEADVGAHVVTKGRHRIAMFVVVRWHTKEQVA